MEMQWHYLKDEPKWKSLTDNSSKRTKNSASGAYSSSLNLETPTSKYDTPSSTTTRPISWKAAKRKGKEKPGKTVTGFQLGETYKSRTECMTKIASECMTKIASAKEISAKAKLEKVRMEEISTLFQDTSGMSARQLATHKFLCEEIRKKYGLP